MHHIFVTEGIVLGRRSLGEANTSVSLLTRELGLVRASARSARLAQSKLKYGLQTLTRGRYSLVRGKHEWRLTGVEQISRGFITPIAERAKAFGRISRLLLRLVAGEEPTPKLFETVSEGFASLAAALSDTDAEAIECVLVLRALAALGYLPQRTELMPFVASSLFSLELTEQAAKSRTLLIKAINESLGATGL